LVAGYRGKGDAGLQDRRLYDYDKTEVVISSAGRRYEPVHQFR
jgi:hypothetical protein